MPLLRWPHGSRRLQAQQAGTRLDFVTGQIETVAGGRVRRAAGVFQVDADGTPHIFVQADSRARSPEQLYRHELFHSIVAQNRGLWQQIVEHLNRNYTQEEIASIVGSYVDAFDGCYGVDEADVERYLEEIFADVYAEMDRGGGRERASREAVQPVAQRFAGDIENARQNRAGIERRNGPGTRLSAEDNSRLNQEDLDEYLSVGNTGHVRDKKQDQVKAGESPILNSPAEIYDFIDRSIRGEIRDTIKAYGKVGSRMASDVQSKDASVNIQGYYLEIESNHFSHLSDHIDQDNDYRNIPLTEEEAKNIPYYLDSYDDVLTVTRKKDGAVKIKFGKRINGHCIIVETVSKGRKAIHTRTAWKMDTVDYLAKYKMNGSATPKRASANSSQGAGPFTSSISQSNGKNNTSATKNTGIDWVYIDAVKKGWTQEVQWMVEDAAKRAGFTHKGFHQTGADFTSFSTKNEVAGQFDDETPTGIFIKPTDEDIGLQSGTKQMPLFFKADNMLEFANREEIRKYWIENVPGYRELDAQLQARNREMERQYDELDAEWDRIYRETYDSDDQSALDEVERRQDEFLERWNRELQPLRRQMKNLITEYMKGTDYDGIHLQYDGKVYGGPRVETYIVFNPEQVKSGEPIVRDDSGKVIPLSERFRTDRTGTEAWKNRDIRFSPAEEEDGVDWAGNEEEEDEAGTETYSEREDLQTHQRADESIAQQLKEQIGVDWAGNRGTRLSPAEEDGEYLELAERPEENETQLQEMVDEAARKAGYETVYMYRGDPETHNVLLRQDEMEDFDPEIGGKLSGNLGFGIYFTSDPAYAAKFGPVRRFYLKMDRAADISADQEAQGQRALRSDKQHNPALLCTAGRAGGDADPRDPARDSGNRRVRDGRHSGILGRKAQGRLGQGNLGGGS